MPHKDGVLITEVLIQSKVGLCEPKGVLYCEVWNVGNHIHLDFYIRYPDKRWYFVGRKILKSVHYKDSSKALQGIPLKAGETKIK